MTESKRDRLERLYKENGLLPEDMFKLKRGNKEIPIILRQGIEKIQAKQSISVSYNLLFNSEDNSTAIILTEAKKGNRTIQTFGEVSPTNNSNPYPIAMCEKRGLSRAVLKLSGFYQEGFYGEDEIEAKPDEIDKSQLDELLENTRFTDMERRQLMVEIDEISTAEEYGKMYKYLKEHQYQANESQTDIKNKLKAQGL